MQLPEVDTCLPTRNYGFIQCLSTKILSWRGWTVTGNLPQTPKCIMAVAPHTSNWDFFVGIGVMFCLQLKIAFLGKDSIFVWPLKPFLNAIGGIGVDRSHHHGVVGQMVDEFKHNDQFILALSPEGTRSKVKEWKTGFLHIAKQAEVPVVAISLDYGKKQVHFHEPRMITGDIDTELADFKAIFTDVCAKNPQAV